MSFEKYLQVMHQSGVRAISVAHVLETLTNEGPVMLTTLGRKVGVSSSAITGIVDRLSRDGLAERIYGDDRRVILAGATSNGEKLVRRARAALNRTQ